MNPSVTLAISTFNRAYIWKRGLMHDSISKQTDDDFEVIIVDDNSTDDTLDVLRELFKDNPKVRVYHCNAPKINATQADALPKNILIKEARGTAFLSLDDDGWIDYEAVALVKSFQLHKYQAAYFGEIRMVEPNSLEEIWVDQRTHILGLNRIGCWLVEDDKNREHGCIWVTATSLLRHLGGYDMSMVAFRGSDTRIGLRLKRMTRTWFCNKQGLRFHHLGRSWTQVNVKDQDYVRSLHKNPLRDKIDLPLIANGGEKFWTSGVLDELYEPVLDG